MHVVIIIELMTIVSLIIAFKPTLIPMFFHMDSIREFISYFQSWNFITIVVVIVNVRGEGNNKGEK
jgi:hypothetical protein